MTAAADWTGRVGDVWAAEWRRTDRSFAALDPHLNAATDAAAPRTGTAIDIGCGAGTTAIALQAARPHLTVIGADLSTALLDVARSRVEGSSGPSFVHGDAPAVAADHAPVDLYVSRHGVMFFDDPVAAFTALRRAAGADARLVFSCFRAATLNAFASELVEAVGGGPIAAGDAPGPFALADPNRIAAILTAAGWRTPRVAPVDFAYRAGEGDDPVADATGFLCRIGPAAARLRSLPDGERAAARGRMTAVAARRRAGNAIDFPAAAWIVSTTAAKDMP